MNIQLMMSTHLSGVGQVGGYFRNNDDQHNVIYQLFKIMQSSKQRQYLINNTRNLSASSNSFINQIPTVDSRILNQNDRQINRPQIPIPSRQSQISRKLENRISAYSIKGIPLNSIQQKKNTLQKYRYINQLARLEYEQKEEEVYTKYTKLSKQTVLKKIKARNQIAQFEEVDQDENEGYDQLLQFKFGKEKQESFHFQKEQADQFQFCQFCDSIYNCPFSQHRITCQKKRSEQPELYSPYSDIYVKESLSRIKSILLKINDTHYQQLLKQLIELQKLLNPGKSIFVKNKDKIKQIIKDIKQDDALFNKIIKKMLELCEKI